MKGMISIVSALIVLWTLPLPSAENEFPLPGRDFEEVSEELAKEKRCLSCHEGIEIINPLMAESWGADTKCEVCHKGNPTATTKEAAHKGMIVHPGDLRVVNQTCGQCHDDRGVIRRDVEGLIPSVVTMSRVVSRGERNHVPRVLRNIMSTAAGEIAATRYLWGAQETKNARYGVRAVESMAKGRPAPFSVKALKELPPAAHSDVDNLLRNQCLKCHLWTRGEAKPGLYRGGGCDACHVLYADDGLSRTGDQTISKTAPGHPQKHEITVKIPTSQCLHCHNNEGNHIGMSYCGLSFTRGGVPYQADGTPQPPIYGVNTQQTWPDVHFAAGMECIDCHTSKEVHGTGDIYSSKNHEVAITCESCHGNVTAPATLKDRTNENLKNIVSQGNALFVQYKLTDQKRQIPQVDKLLARDALPVAMRIPAHLQPSYDEKGAKEKNRLECYACHGTTAPQYYGYQFRRDDRRMAPVDWVNGIGEGSPPSFSQGSWDAEFTYHRLENPVLGINNNERVAPFIPEYQTFFTAINAQGEASAINQVLKTASGKNSLAFTSIQPHTITRQALRCEYCHANPKALGLGDVGMTVWREGWTVENPLDRIVDEEGNQIQEMARKGTRPFTRAEMDRMDRLNSCISCHQHMENSEIWKQITDVYGFAKTNQRHKEIIEQMFNRVIIRDKTQ